MAKIPEKMRWIYDLLLTAAILATATVLCTLLRRIDDGSGYVNLIFVLAVATISRWTEGYFWGIFSAVSGVLFVNYVFTYPYWEFNFTITGYPFTFLAMLTVSMMISAMNTQIKKQERLRQTIKELGDSIAYIDWKQNFYDEVLSGKRPYVSNLIRTEND